MLNNLDGLAENRAEGGRIDWRHALSAVTFPLLFIGASALIQRTWHLEELWNDLAAALVTLAWFIAAHKTGAFPWPKRNRRATGYSFLNSSQAAVTCVTATGSFLILTSWFEQLNLRMVVAACVFGIMMGLLGIGRAEKNPPAEPPLEV